LLTVENTRKWVSTGDESCTGRYYTIKEDVDLKYASEHISRVLIL
jgi:hypothetical protein